MSVKESLRNRAKKSAENAAALFFALKRKETPLLAKILIAVAVCYALSPIDLIPDFIPVIGLLDDAFLLPLMIAAAVKLTPPAVMDDCRRQAIGTRAAGRPGKYLCALPVAAIWLAVIAGLAGAILRR
jgi:uncharacterized membrane protein YkvA (DUF1232 family)